MKEVHRLCIIGNSKRVCWGCERLFTCRWFARFLKAHHLQAQYKVGYLEINLLRVLMKIKDIWFGPLKHLQLEVMKLEKSPRKSPHAPLYLVTGWPQQGTILPSSTGSRLRIRICMVGVVLVLTRWKGHSLLQRVETVSDVIAQGERGLSPFLQTVLQRMACLFTR